MEYTGQELVSYQNGNLGICDNSAQVCGVGGYPNTYLPYPYYPFYEEHIHFWYPSIPYVTEKSKVEQAFKIITKLLEHKIIEKEITVKELIKMVNEIAEII